MAECFGCLKISKKIVRKESVKNICKKIQYSFKMARNFMSLPFSKLFHSINGLA